MRYTLPVYPASLPIIPECEGHLSNAHGVHGLLLLI